MDRPGYGASSPKPGRTLLDWPTDVAAVADALGLGEFHLVGVSGGGPFAAAVAAVLPGRIRGLALINPVPPADTPGLDGAEIAKLLWLGQRPRRARLVFSAVRAFVGMRLLTAKRLIGAGLAEADRACLSPPVLAGIDAVWREALRPGVAGALSDAMILAQPWGFDLASVQVPTTVWIGVADTMVPAAAASAYAGIPGVVIETVEAEGHYSLPLRHAPRILQALVRNAC